MKEYKFYINGIEVYEPMNWVEVKTKLKRSQKYNGVIREASLDRVKFGLVPDVLEENNGFFILTELFEDFGLNADATFLIEKYNYDTGVYEYFQEFDFNFEDCVQTRGKETTIDIGMVSAGVWQKIEARESLELPIDATESIEGVALTPPAIFDVDFVPRPLTLGAVYENNETPGATELGSFIILPIELTAQNNNSFQSVVGGSILDVTAPNDTSVFVPDPLLFENCFGLVIENQTWNSAEFRYNYTFEIDGLSAGGFAIELYEGEWDGTQWLTPTLIDSVPFSVAIGLQTIATGNQLVTFNRNTSRYLFFGININANGGSVINVVKFSGTATLEYNEESFQVQRRKAYKLLDCLKSTAQQITDVPNVLIDSVFAGSILEGAFVSSGLMLRGAKESTGADARLNCSFLDLFETANKLLPMSLEFDGTNLILKPEAQQWGTNEEFLEPSTLEISLANDYIYTAVEVGNNKLQYEANTGLFEHNQKLEFSLPTRAKSNKLNLISNYQTDYLPVQLAINASFANEDNADTKYDDKNFVIQCNLSGGIWTSTPALVIGAEVSGIIPFLLVYNLFYSPKRMLLRHAQKLKASVWFDATNQIRFDKASGLARMTSKLTTEAQAIVEVANVDLADIANPFYEPIAYKVEIGKRDIEKIIENPANFFTFTFKNVQYSGYLIEAEIDKQKGTATLIKKW